MCNLVRQEGQPDRVSAMARRCMTRFLDSLDPDTVPVWRRSLLLAAACLLVTSKIVSKVPLSAKLLLKYAGAAFSMEELTVRA